ncbi:MAG TPA: DUF4397 domain-containing protein [Terracidiphilus sp.]|jgi:hypothetical protein|nr:DUF4397 domain-containing protein [Terracidiphilus sp.]
MLQNPASRNEPAKSAFTLTRLLLVAAASIAVAFGLSACQVVAGFSQPSLVRVIDASYIAPAVNIYVQSTIFAGNVGEGYISNYGTTAPSGNALVQVNAADGNGKLIAANATLAPGAQHSVFLTDNGSVPTLYTVTVLQDAQAPAPAGNVQFRFLNQAPRTGALDVYMVPSGNTVANSIPICSNIAVGQTCGYVTFAAQTVTMVITPTGVTTPKYTSQGLSLTSGQVRTVVMVDSQLTANPPVNVVIANDVD